MKRRATKSQLEFLKQELSHFERSGVISAEQNRMMLSSYEVRTKFSFIHVLLVIGSLLIGAGVLSFIAGNWSLFPKTLKFMIILMGLSLFYLAGWKTERIYPKTSKSLYYVGMFIYGAGIFLVGQMFNLDGDYRGAFLLWALGVIPLAIYLRDKWVAIFTIFLMYVHGNTFNPWDAYSFALLFFIPFMYWLNERRFEQSRILLFFNNALAVQFFISNLIKFEVKHTWITVLLFIAGLLMIFVTHPRYKGVFVWQGSVLLGITGIIMTFNEFWKEFDLSHPTSYNLVFSLLFIGIILFLIKRGILPAIILACALILRYYADLSFDFLPKSLFFIIGGLILIGFGYWFEKKRREGGRQSV